MTLAVLLAVPGGPGLLAGDNPLLAPFRGRPLAGWAMAAMSAAGLDESVVVVDDADGDVAAVAEALGLSVVACVGLAVAPVESVAPVGTVAPIRSTVAPIGPAVAPVGPTVAPIGPAVAPVGPTVAPVGPAVAPVQSAVAPGGPAIAPVSSTLASVEPAVPSVGPAVAWSTALAEAARGGHGALVVGRAQQALVPASAWARLAACPAPVACATYRGVRGFPVRLGREAWAGGSGEDVADACRDVLTGPGRGSHWPEVEVAEVECPGLPTAVGTVADVDALAVTALLGREPQGDFAVVARGQDGGPVVIRCAPLLRDGRPMPTRHWLVGEAERLAVSRLEAGGGVRRAEAAVPPATVAATHARAETERRSALPPGWSGPRPGGGVAGTRHGVKCLHAHYAELLAGVDDPVGRWVADRLAGIPE